MLVSRSRARMSSPRATRSSWATVLTSSSCRRRSASRSRRRRLATKISAPPPTTSAVSTATVAITLPAPPPPPPAPPPPHRPQPRQGAHHAPGPAAAVTGLAHGLTPGGRADLVDPLSQGGVEIPPVLGERLPAQLLGLASVERVAGRRPLGP